MSEPLIPSGMKVNIDSLPMSLRPSSKDDALDSAKKSPCFFKRPIEASETPMLGYTHSP